MTPGSTETAVANGDTRTLHLYHAHTHESIAATFKVNGQYDPSVLAQLNHFLRDWRNNEQITMDPRLFDTVWEVYRESGSQQPIEVLSAYRSPQTNAMLRRRTRGVAEHSQHILGHAMDQHYMDVPMSRIRDLGMRLQRGGVGFYPTSGTPFVHLDVGGVRHWPRMSYEQLSRLFPDGKTVHIPSNGVPLPGYEQARAELAARGDDSSYPTVAEVKSKGFFAWLFGGGGGDEQEDNGEAGVRSTPPRSAPQVASLGSATPQGDMYGKQEQQRGLFASPQSQPVAPSRIASAASTREAARQKLAAAMALQQSTIGTTAPSLDAGGGMAVPPQPTEVAQPVTPLPPRRPVELAALGPTPMPPSRPPELSGEPHDSAPAHVGAVLANAGFPAVITQGPEAARAAGLALAYAAQPTTPDRQLRSATPAPTNAGVSTEARASAPLPVTRPPDLLSAHLDRANFRSLTRPVSSERSEGRSALGAPLPPIRAAMRASFDAFAPLPQTLPGSFGGASSNLPVGRFTAPDKPTASLGQTAGNDLE